MTPKELLALEDIAFLQELVNRYPEMQYIAGPAYATPEGNPTLRADAITYKVFNLESVEKNAIEAERTLLSLLIFKWVLNNDYSKVTAIQKDKERLSPESFAKWQDLTRYEAASDEDLEFCLYSIACNDLGKTFFYAEKHQALLGGDAPDHDLLLYNLLTRTPEIFPAFRERLTPLQQSVYIEGLGANLNLGQMVQGENFPYNLQAMQALPAKSRGLRLICELFDFAGILGHVNANGSLIMTQENYESYSLDITELMAEPKEEAYQRYICKRGRSVGLKEDEKTSDGFAKARLITLARVFKAQEAEIVLQVWNDLEPRIRAVLTRELNVTGLAGERGILIYYAPALIANAIKGLGSYAKGLHYALNKFAEIYQRERTDAVVGNGVITINVADLAKEALQLSSCAARQDASGISGAPLLFAAPVATVELKQDTMQASIAPCKPG